MSTNDAGGENTTKKVKKIEVAREIFNSNLKNLAELGDRQFRKNITTAIKDKTGCTLASAASMYNVCKHDAEARGDVTGLGRNSAVKVVATETADIKTTEEPPTEVSEVS